MPPIVILKCISKEDLLSLIDTTNNTSIAHERLTLRESIDYILDNVHNNKTKIDLINQVTELFKAYKNEMEY